MKIVRIYHILFFPLSPKFFSFLGYTVLDHVIIQGGKKKSMLLVYYLPHKNVLRSSHCLTLPSWLRRKPIYKHMQEKKNTKNQVGSPQGEGSGWTSVWGRRSERASITFPQPLTVTVASKPSGTLATMMPMRKMTASSQVYSRIRERMKKDTPRNTATPVMMWIKCSISAAMGVWPPSSPEASVAILPITVRSPVYTTMPRAVP